MWYISVLKKENQRDSFQLFFGVFVNLFLKKIKLKKKNMISPWHLHTQHNKIGT